MSITVAERLIQRPDDISELARLAIAFIDGGIDWLRWAIAEPASRYAFADESALSAGVQQGLQVSRFALAPRLGLLVSPVKLMTLGLPDLRVIAKAEMGDEGSKVDVHARRILDAHGLLTQADFDSGAAFLNQLGVATAPVFQFMGFEDRLATYELARASVSEGEPDLALEKEAAAFGVAQARTPREFADYFSIYMELATGPNVPAVADKRAARAESALHALLPLLFGALDCPQVEGLVAPGEVAEAVNVWLMWGRAVGFSRLSAGARQIVENTRYRAEPGQHAREFVDGYISAAQMMLGTVAAERGVMAQDGATCVFPLETRDHEAALQLNPLGVISLSAFRRKPKPKPATASAKTAAAGKTPAAAKAPADPQMETTP